MFALIAACGGSGNGDDAEPPGQNGTLSGLDAVAVATVTPTLPAAPTPTLEEVLRGFAYPIEGGCLPEGNQLMPNAPREYRQGTHEGVDFYDVDNCTPVTVGTPV